MRHHETGTVHCLIILTMSLAVIAGCTTGRRGRGPLPTDSSVETDARVSPDSEVPSPASCAPLRGAPDVQPGEFFETYQDPFDESDSQIAMQMLDCGVKADGRYLVEATRQIDGCSRDERWKLELPFYTGPGELFGGPAIGVDLYHDGGSCIGDDGLNETDCSVCTSDGLNTVQCNAWRYGDGSGPALVRLSWRCP